MITLTQFIVGSFQKLRNRELLSCNKTKFLTQQPNKKDIGSED